MRRLSGLSPIEINDENQHIAAEYLRKKSAKMKAYDYGLTKGAHVRIMLPIKFASGNSQRYSDEIFTIVEKLSLQKPVLFRLSDAAGENLAQLW